MPASATAVLDRLLEPVGRTMPAGFARELLEIRAEPDLQARIDALAAKGNEGQWTDDERAEYDGYIQVIHLVAILQSKARQSLTGRAG